MASGVHPSPSASISTGGGALLGLPRYGSNRVIWNVGWILHRAGKSRVAERPLRPMRVMGKGVMNRPESPAVANALATLCLSLVSVILALMVGLALALAIIFALALWYLLPALVPRQ
jgi:hypothetical protein